MFFQKKLDRSMDWLSKKNRDIEGKSVDEEELNTNENDIELEKKDMLALIISALFIFIPIAIIVLGVILFLGWLLF